MQRIFKTIFLATVLMGSFNAISQEYRSIDGFNNNPLNPEMGAAHSMLAYWTRLDYADGISVPKMDMEFSRPNPRMISNSLFAQNGLIPEKKGLSDFTWVFGQFVDHDITLTENSGFELLDNIVIPDNDAFFTPGSIMPVARNRAMEGTGTDITNPRRHSNSITAFVDGSAIYGSNQETANWLRASGGKLKVSSGNLLPWNTIDGEFNSRIDPDAPFMADDTRSQKKLYVAGDIRANENPLLTSFHTLFVREHNRLADKLAFDNPDWDDEKIYQEAKKWNSAFLQSIVFNEWLPTMGIELPSYSGYKDNVDPSIANVFSAAAFRVGHTLINGTILMMDNNGNELSSGNLTLREAFFNPKELQLKGIDPYFKGMGSQIQQSLDCKVVDDVRNFLFGEPGKGGMDLAAININRGRERGLSDFNTIRADIGLPTIPSFSVLTDSPEEAAILESVYGSVDNIDPWVGMLAEKKVRNTIFGETMHKIIERQFQAIRDGDRFFYLNDPSFTAEEKQIISKTLMYDVLMRNTDLEIMQHQVFIAKEHKDLLGGPELEPIDFNAVAYPNPVFDNLTVKIFSEKERAADIILYSYTGQAISSFKRNLSAGDNFIDIAMDSSSCPRGLYNVMIKFGDKFQVLKVIKER
jgi:hypothetical protein